MDTYAYFGELVYTYSLREGINDGYLTPFKVRQIATTLDDYVYTPDDTILEGEAEEGRRYTEPDFNRVIEIEARESYRVKLFMEAIDPREKTLVFCAPQAHALAVRNLVNQMKSNPDPNYCVRVTADEGARGDAFPAQFQDNEKTIPTIGMDARNIRNIELMRPIKSMIEFKQIIGRGTRLFDGKDFFTILDFVKAYEHFNDPEWDGEPIEPEKPKPKPDPPSPTDTPPDGEGDDEDKDRPKRLKIRLADGRERALQSMTATTYWSPDGRPMSAAQFIEKLFGELPGLFKDEDELRLLWSVPATRKALLEKLSERGFDGASLDAMRQLIDAVKSDLFDVLAYVAYARAPITRAERAEGRRDKILSSYDEKLGAFLDFVLGEYVRVGDEELNPEKLGSLIELKYYSAYEAEQQVGGVGKIREAFIGFQPVLYDAGE